MKILNKYVLKEQTIPFLYALSVLVFVLLSNFLLRTIDRYLGKGLPIAVIFEMIFLNLAWILALAVPMAVLVATLMAFGRLSADSEIVAIRSSGVSYYELIRPALLFGVIVTAMMIYFSNWVLPVMNHKARVLNRDVSRKRPDLEFEAGYFIESIPGYSILIAKIDDEFFHDLLIFTKGEPRNQRTIVAKRARFESLSDGVIFHLFEGAVHESALNAGGDYRRIGFDAYDVLIPMNNLNLERRENQRLGEREMNAMQLLNSIDKYKNRLSEVSKRSSDRLSGSFGIHQAVNPENYPVLLANVETRFEQMRDSIQNVDKHRIANRQVKRLQNVKNAIGNDAKLSASYLKSINRYSVELFKKFSIPFACFVFVLIGSPLGILVKKGNFAVSMALSIGFFIIYWVMLIGGEELADRRLFEPWLAMWLPNIFLGFVGLYLIWFTSRENKTLRFSIHSLIKKTKI